MSAIAHLLNGAAVLWSLTEVVDDWGDAVNAYAPQHDGTPQPIRITPPTGGLAGTAAGVRPVGQEVAFGLGDLGSKRTDILQVTEGPEAGTRWRVLEVAHPSGTPVAHHTEMTVEPWTGKLPGDE